MMSICLFCSMLEEEEEALLVEGSGFVIAVLGCVWLFQERSFMEEEDEDILLED